MTGSRPNAGGARAKRLAAVSLALVGLASTAAAAKPDSQAGETIRRMHSYGRCVVQQAPSDSKRVLGKAPGSKEERSLLHAISSDLCLNGQGGLEQIDFQPEWLRGEVAEEVLRRERGGDRIMARAVRVAPFPRLSDADVAALDQRGQRTLRGLGLAECVQAAAPQAVAELLKTDPTSPEEDRTFRQVAPYLGPCFPQNAETTLLRPQLRGFLAEAAYRADYFAAHGSN